MARDQPGGPPDAHRSQTTPLDHSTQPCPGGRELPLHLLKAGAPLAAAGRHHLAGGNGLMDVGLEGGMQLPPGLDWPEPRIGLLPRIRCSMTAGLSSGSSVEGLDSCLIGPLGP